VAFLRREKMGSICGRALKSLGLLLFLALVLFSTSLHQANAAYPAPKFQDALVFSSHNADGTTTTNFFARISGPSPEDVVSFSASGPSGTFNLDPSLSFRQYGLYYGRAHGSIVTDGTYTLQVTDSLGRSATVVRNFTYNGTVPQVNSTTMSPGDGAYVGTTTPTLSFDPVAGAVYYQVMILDYDSKAIWYISPITTATSFAVPSGLLQPDTAYVWEVRVWDSDSDPQNRHISDRLHFYTGTENTPVLNTGGILALPLLNGDLLNFLYSRGINVAPWDIKYFKVTGPPPDSHVYDLTTIRYYGFQFSAFNAKIKYLDPPTQSIPDGTYTIEIEDNAGRAATPFTREYAYNPVPDFSADSRVPADNAYFNTGTPSFSWARVTGDPGDGSYRYSLRITDYITGIRWYDSPWSADTSFTLPKDLNLPRGSSYKWRVNVFGPGPTGSSGTDWNNYRNSDYRTFTINEHIFYVNKDDETCGGNSPCFSSIQEAVREAGSGVTIKVVEGNYHEFLLFNGLKDLILECGWDPAYTTKSSSTKIYSMTIKSGTLSVENLVIRTPHPDDALAQGLVALSNGEILKAKKLFESASLAYGSQVFHNADVARFFYALTRAAALWFDMYSDGNPDNGLNTLGDILDAFGFSSSGRDPWDFGGSSDPCPETLPSTSPTGGDLQAFLYNVVRPEIEGAINSLDMVAQSFSIDWTEPLGSTSVESDYGDVLFFRAIAKGLLALILVQHAYDLDADIDTEANDPANTIESFLGDNPGFLTLTNASCLSTAKAYLHGGLDDANDAIDWIQAETDDQSNDLINLMDTTPEEIAEAKELIAYAKAGLDGQYTLDGGDTPSDPRDDTIIDMSKFFAGIDLRSLLPSFVGDNASGLLPYPGLGGILVKLEGKDPSDLNKDLDGDGTADIFGDRIYYVYGGEDISGDLSPHKSNTGANPEGYGFTFLGVGKSPDGARDFGGAYSYYLTKGRSLFKPAHIDAFEFLGVGSYCCLSAWDHIDGWWQDYSGQPDDWYVGLGYEHYILLSAPPETTGIKVYGLP